jgi:hypothetical protein
MAIPFAVAEQLGEDVLETNTLGLGRAAPRQLGVINRQQAEADQLLRVASQHELDPNSQNQFLHDVDLWFESGNTFTEDLQSGFQDNNGTVQAWQYRNLPPAQNVGQKMSRGLFTVQISIISTLLFLFMLMLGSELDAHRTDNWYRTFAFLWILDFVEACILLMWSLDTWHNDGHGAVVMTHDGQRYHVRQGRQQQQNLDYIRHPEWNTAGRKEKAFKLATGWIVLASVVTCQILIAQELDGSSNIPGAGIIAPLLLGGVTSFALMVYLAYLRACAAQALDRTCLFLAAVCRKILRERRRRRKGSRKRKAKQLTKEKQRLLFYLAQRCARYRDDSKRAFWITVGLLLLSLLIIAFLSLLASRLSDADGSASGGIENYYLVFIPVWISILLASILWFLVSVVPWWVPVMDSGGLALYFLTLAGVATSTILLPLRLETTIRVSWFVVLLPFILALAVLMLATCGFLLCRNLIHPPEPHWHTLADRLAVNHVLHEQFTNRTHNIPFSEEGQGGGGGGVVGGGRLIPETHHLPYKTAHQQQQHYADLAAATTTTAGLGEGEQGGSAHTDEEIIAGLSECKIQVMEQLSSDQGEYRQFMSAAPARVFRQF